MNRRSIIRKLLLLTAITILGLAMLSFSGKRPDHLGVSNGQLYPVPDSPNAVSTQTDDVTKSMPAIELNGLSPAAAMEKIVKVVDSLPRTMIVERSDNYLHVEFRSLIFRFVDDVEFFIDAETDRVHFRSASRVGHSDLGANRKRMENIVALCQQQFKQH